ncbi:hypothetical protein QTO01_04935 [Vibrio mytili]|uniref:hypothetical protein n=1 Tax=Vibrio mytili TaxID=50718 RepID=UPI002F425778
MKKVLIAAVLGFVSVGAQAQVLSNWDDLVADLDAKGAVAMCGSLAYTIDKYDIDDSADWAVRGDAFIDEMMKIMESDSDLARVTTKTLLKAKLEEPKDPQVVMDSYNEGKVPAFDNVSCGQYGTNKLAFK